MSSKKKAKKRGVRCYVVLARQDIEPKDGKAYPLDKVLADPRYHLTRETIRDLRRRSYEAAKESMLKVMGKDESLSRLPEYWNAQVIDFDDSINLFSTIPEFYPISHKVRMYTHATSMKQLKEQGVKAWYEYVDEMSFVINKVVYDRFIATGEVSGWGNQATDTDGEKLRRKRIIIVVKDRETGEEASIRLRNVPMVQLWKTWCKANGLTMGDAIVDAMKIQMQLKPGEVVLPGIEEFAGGNTVNDYSYAFPEKLTAGKTSTIKRQFKIKSSILEETKTMLVRYNRAAELTGKRHLTFNEYVNRALILMNRAINQQILKFSDEYMQYEQDMEFYREHIDPDDEGEEE